ncbi:MAG: TonB-dependent receptor domain-containing protein [Candidatus Kapaibacterium sp.]
MKTLLLAILMATSFSAVMAQNGVIEGKVSDATTGEVLRQATVAVVNAKRGSYTDTKGAYRIKKLDAGTYSLKVTYVGYDAKIVEGVQVTPDGITTLDILLQPTVQSGKEIVISATRINDNAAALLLQRKNAAQVSDGVGREEMSKLPDSDAGQALKRVSGVTLLDGKYVYVRGVSDRYSNTTLNGAALTSTEPDRKAFAFDMFPTELLENANVVKSFTPDLPGNFAGGLVQLNTVDFPSSTGLKVSASQGFNDFVTFKDNAFFQTGNVAGDNFAMGATGRSIPVGFPQNRLEMNQLLRDVRSGNADAIAKMDGFGKDFNNVNWASTASTATPNGGLSLTYTNIIPIDDAQEVGFVASANYGTSWQNNVITRAGVLSNPEDFLFKFDGVQSTRSVSWGGLFNIAYRVGSGGRISFKNAYNRSADFENVALSGTNFAQSQAQRLFSFQYVEKQLYSGALTGEHNLSALGNSLVDWKLGYSNSTRSEPDFRRLQFLRDAFDPNQPYTAAFDLSPQGAGSRAGRFFSELDDHAISGSVNVTVPVTTSIKVKFGSLFENRSRTFNARSLTIVQGAENDISGNLTITDAEKYPDLGKFFADSNFSVERQRLSYSEDSKLSDQYDALENLVAGYLMVDLPFEIAGLDGRLVTGARVEKNIQLLNSFTVTDDRVNVYRDLVDILPAFNLILRPLDNLNIRTSASQTLARPSLREFAPFQFYDFGMQATVSGNPNLVRALIKNYDLRVEYFPSSGEVLSASFFYKRFDNAIEETLFPQQSELVRSYANASGPANNLGVEIELRKSLGFIGSSMRDFMFSLNAAFIDSRIVVQQAGVDDERSMWGQSPYTINTTLSYFNPSTRTAVTLAYNTYGRRIIQVNLVGVFQGDPHVYELPRHVVDFSVIQPIGNALELKLSIRDLLNQPLKWEQNGALIQSNIRGMGISLGLGYRM